MTGRGNDAEDDAHYVGHRERLRRRFMEAGEEALADYELLELVLFRAVSRRDVKPMAKALLARFGSFADVLAAPPQRLREIDSVGDAIVTELKVVLAATRRVAKGQIARRPVLASWASVISYCRSAMAFEAVEQFRVLFLDKKNVLIADEVQQTGTVDHTPVYPREIVKRALELSASAVVLVHNHPSGDPTPSQADIAMTRTIVEIPHPLGIEVHDHLIVGRDGHASFKGLRLL